MLGSLLSNVCSCLNIFQLSCAALYCILVFTFFNILPYVIFRYSHGSSCMTFCVFDGNTPPLADKNESLCESVVREDHWQALNWWKLDVFSKTHGIECISWKNCIGRNWLHGAVIQWQEILILYLILYFDNKGVTHHINNIFIWKIKYQRSCYLSNSV